MPVMELLRQLDEVDVELDGLKEKLAEGPRRLEESLRRISELEARIGELKERENLLASAAQKLEMDVQKHEAEVEKYISHQRQAKSNEEYQVFRERVEQERDIISRLEEDALLKMEEQDELRSQRGTLTEELRRAQEEHRRLEAEVAREAEELEARIGRLEARRREITGQIDPDDLDVYERVRKSRSGRALAPIQGSACGACFVSLPPQLINLALLGKSICQCISCHRILYVEDAEEVLRAPRER